MAALVGPFVIDWNSYRSTFEQEAEKILGQPVHVDGEDVRATLLPTPSIVFTNVRVGESEGRPMMTVDRFSIEIELMPLLRGEISISDMVLDRPRMNVSVDDSGRVDWLLRSQASRSLDPSRVAIQRVTVSDGEISFADGKTGAAFRLTGINTNLVEAKSLNGPWRVDAMMVCEAAMVCGEGMPAAVRLTTGRLADDGTIKVSAEVTPADIRAAGTLNADGTLGSVDGILSYKGDFRFTKVYPQTATAEPGQELPPTITLWRIAGKFDLTPARLQLDDFTFSGGDAATALNLAGQVRIGIGNRARFDGSLEAKQIDFDRALGGGPSRPVAVADAVTAGVNWLKGAGSTRIPGRFDVHVPSIVLGGSVLQELRFALTSDAEAWKIDGLTVQLPGRTQVTADGALTTGDQLGFTGAVRLTSQQPAALAAWRLGRGRSVPGLTALDPVDFRSNLTLAPGVVQADDVTLSIGEATMTGWFGLGPMPARPSRQRLSVNLNADSVDWDQLRGLGLAMMGADFDPAQIASDYSVRFAAGKLRAAGTEMSDVAVDAGFADGALTIDNLLIGDLAGARLKITGGRLDSLNADAVGQLTAELDAADLDGVSRLLQSLAPDHPMTRWLAAAAPALAPAHLVASLEAPARNGFAFGLRVAGKAAGTDLDFELGGNPAGWRNSDARLVVNRLATANSAELLRQAGLAAKDVASPLPADLHVSVRYTPSTGGTAQMTGTFAGLDLNVPAAALELSDGGLSVKAAGFSVTSGDVEPLLAMVGLDLQGLGKGTAARLAGTIDSSTGSSAVVFSDSTIGGQPLSGRLEIASEQDVWRLGGQIAVDSMDLGWVSALALGGSPLPTGAADAPWPTDTFTGPVFGALRAKLGIDLRALTAGGLTISNPHLDLALGPDGGSLDIGQGTLAGGTLQAKFDARTASGVATLDGQLAVEGAALSDLVWRRDGQPVAEGKVDLTANFSGTGRSPAGLVSTLAGGGTLDLAAGAFHFVNPETFDLVIRAADDGQDLGEEKLQRLVAGYLDAGTLKFDRASAAFDIAAGVIEPRTVFIDGSGATTVVKSRIDLGQMALDSSWDISLGGGRDVIEGITPEVYVNFSGPIADPSRQINVAPLMGYLAVRSLQLADRMQADILERERLNRELDLLQQQRVHREEDARNAAEAARRAEEDRQAAIALQAADEANRRQAARDLAQVLVDEATARQQEEEAAARRQEEEAAARRAQEERDRRNAAPIPLLPQGLQLRPAINP